MPTEYHSSPEDWPEDDWTEEDRLRFVCRELRIEAKDMRMYLNDTAEDFPNRAKLLKLVNEILSLVPIKSQEAEERDNHKREEARADRLRSGRERG